LTICVKNLPEVGETINALSTQSGLGGKGLNQAVAASRAGADVRLVAAVGTDAIAISIKDLLRTENITGEFLIERSGQSDLSVIIVGEGGENVIVTNASQAESITEQEVEARFSVSKQDTLLLQGNLLPEPTLRAAQLAKRAGASVIFNPAPYKDSCREMAKMVDILILNSVEAARWTETENPEHAIKNFAAPLTIVTLGSEGCLVKEGQGASHKFPAPLLTSVDSTGAGDTFIGVFAAEWIKSTNVRQSVKLAVTAASASVMHQGAIASIPTRDQILQMR
jgi:ribokinase